MIRNATALMFHDHSSAGRHRPLRVSVRAEREEFEVYLKIPGVNTGGDLFTVVGAINECVAYLLAQDLDVSVPEALCVKVPGVLIPEMIPSDTTVHAFGSRLQSGVTKVSNFNRPGAEQMMQGYHFDGMTGNEDRTEGDNPNVLIGGGKAHFIDHEFCFPGPHRDIPPEPWESAESITWLCHHVFRPFLKRADPPPMWQNYGLGAGDAAIILSSVPSVWATSPEGSLHLTVLRRYLERIMGSISTVVHNTHRSI